MTRHTAKTRMLAFCMALTVLTGSLTLVQAQNALRPNAADAASPRLTVDLNKNDGRAASYARNAENWIIDGETSASTEIGGLTFTLSTPSEGGVLTAHNNKKLQKQSGIYPYLTMDGVTVETAENGALQLEITGLSAGTHTLKTWHSACQSGASAGTLRLSVNGRTAAEGVACPVNVNDEDDAGIAFLRFEAAEGEAVTVLIEPEDGSSVWLNGFELDGGDPFAGISRITPAHMDYHHDAEEGLSWTAGSDAVSHDVYFGTDEAAVYGADTNSPEFMGNQTGTTYALDTELSALPTYYWRVDTIDSEGNVHKGSVNAFRLNRLAFPTAEGYGRFAAGGRGGQVIHVTSLNDDVNEEGTLRWALENEIWQTEDWMGVSRIVVFDVGGVIALKDDLCIPAKGGSVYVAGQTAPGDGITLINYGFGAMGANDVIIRDVRLRVGDTNGMNTGGMALSNCDHSIIDHCSMSWATDECFTSRGAKNITFQWNIVAEPVHYAVYYEEPDSIDLGCFAASVGGYTGSYHHNLLMHCTGRSWGLAGAMEQDAVTYGGQADIRNNVVYNWFERTTDGGARRVNFVNNYYKAGPASKTDMHLVSVDGNELSTYDMQMLYADGNMMVDTDGTVLLAAEADEWESGKAVCGEKNATEADIRSDEPFFPSYVDTETAAEAYESVLSHVGAGGTTGRDYIDSLYIDEVINSSYTYICDKCQVPGMRCGYHEGAGDYPTAETFLHSTDGMTNAENDTDRDGMPNVWEEAHGLNPDDPTDGAIVSLSAEDYTNVEMYLNELMGDPMVYKTDVPGDVNTDGTLSAADAVMLQKWLLGAGDLYNTQVADLFQDGRVDAFDLSLMKKMLLQER